MHRADLYSRVRQVQSTAQDAKSHLADLHAAGTLSEKDIMRLANNLQVLHKAACDFGTALLVDSTSASDGHKGPSMQCNTTGNSGGTVTDPKIQSAAFDPAILDRPVFDRGTFNRIPQEYRPQQATLWPIITGREVVDVIAEAVQLEVSTTEATKCQQLDAALAKPTTSATVRGTIPKLPKRRLGGPYNGLGR